MGESKKSNPDPQQAILLGHGAFGVDYVPKAKRVPVTEGRIFAGKRSEFSPGEAKVFPLDRFRIALFKVGEDFFAIKDACPHADYPLSKGKLETGYVVICGSHN